MMQAHFGRETGLRSRAEMTGSARHITIWRAELTNGPLVWCTHCALSGNTLPETPKRVHGTLVDEPHLTFQDVPLAKGNGI